MGALADIKPAPALLGDNSGNRSEAVQVADFVGVRGEPGKITLC